MSLLAKNDYDTQQIDGAYDPGQRGGWRRRGSGGSRDDCGPAQRRIGQASQAAVRVMPSARALTD
jgi:hypothetical protein